ncbi:putative gustatory receptor 2a [Eupeodes corollae]|uniref:putative gustatory receptor 2a n=1 Tax=Eupeodes corollae TaxID=290404 RepID=UPI002493B149|nr:putative gustatory receptor 2a [Eupeodes corollae]
MNILEAILFFHRLFQLCNLTQLGLDKPTWSAIKSRPLKIYSFVILLFSLAILIEGIVNPNLKGKYAGDVGVTVDYIQLIGVRTAYIVCVIEALCHVKEQQALLKNVQEIDRIFEVSLNTDVENRKFRSKIIKNGLVMLIVYFFCECFILAITALRSTSIYIGFWILYTVPLLVCGVRYFQYLLFIDIIKQRFVKLNEVLRSVNLLNAIYKSGHHKFLGRGQAAFKLVKTTDKYSKTMYRDGFDLTKLLVIRDLYSRLWEVCTLVNKCFGLSILIAIGVDFLAITANFYWIFLNFKKFSSSYGDIFRIASSVFWSMPHLYNVVKLAIMCHTTIETTSEIALGVHRIQVDLFNDNHNSLIEQFSLQLLHQKIHFTAFGFFSIDCSLLYTIVGATTTYLIILIQFHMSEQRDVSSKAFQKVIANITQ